MKRVGKAKKSSKGSNFDSSISDLMSCLVFIFIITIVGLAIKLNDVVNIKEQAVQEYSNSVKARNKLMAKIKEDLNKLNIVVFVDDENGVLSFPESTVFDSGEAKVKPTGVKVFKRVGKSLSEYLNCELSKIKYLCSKEKPYELKVDSIIVEGHADPLPLRGRARSRHGSNMHLSLKRSLNTFKLIDLNFESEKYLNSKGEGVLGAAGYGSKKPSRRFATDVFINLFKTDKYNRSNELVTHYNSLSKVSHIHKLGKMNEFLIKRFGISNKERELRKAIYKNYRRIDLRFIMSLPKILKEAKGEISSKDAP